MYLSPGTGGEFYCQNCVRDTALAHALKKIGHDVAMMPIYLPNLIDDKGVTHDIPVFFGGINVYLQQHLSLFRRTPRWLDKLFDTPAMLKFAAAREGSTEAAGLGPMTLSMMQGPQGRQKKELDRMIAWLIEHEKPDVVHLSNALLAGMAGELKRALGVPVVCSLQDEENWLDAIDPPYDQQCWDAMSDQAQHVDAFISVSTWYRDEMQKRMRLEDGHIHVVPLGIELDARDPDPLQTDPPVIGYLSKMCPSLGLGVLVDAFIELKKKPGLEKLRLRATGGQHGPDIAFVKTLRAKLAQHGMEGDVEFLEEFDIAHRRSFLRGLTVMSVPAAEGEAFGMHIIEALSEGVPVVQPRAGAYPEVVQSTGGGLLYDAGDSAGLVVALESLLRDTDRATDLGQKGREVVRTEYSVNVMAERMGALYASLV